VFFIFKIQTDNTPTTNVLLSNEPCAFQYSQVAVDHLIGCIKALVLRLEKLEAVKQQNA
jgi:hypothetical protein